MASPPEKRLRIQRLRDRLPYLSQSALCEVLKVAETEGLPPAASRRTIGRCRDDVAQLQTPYGPLHRTLSVPSRAGAAVELEVQNPFAMLYHTAAVSPYVAGLILQAAQREPPSAASPWKLFLYGDEITPGNQMSYKGERKFWGFYWTIGQFGSAALSDEDNVIWLSSCTVNRSFTSGAAASASSVAAASASSNTQVDCGIVKGCSSIAITAATSTDTYEGHVV